MKKLLFKGRTMTFVSLALVVLLFVGIVAVTIISARRTADFSENRIFIEGKYSIDNGPWRDTVPEKMIDERFSTVTIKGKLSTVVFEDEVLAICADNVWYSLELAKDGETIRTTNLRADDTGPLRDSPGCSIDYFFSLGEEEPPDATLTIAFPYTMFNNCNLSDYLKIYVTNFSGLYEMMFTEKLLSVLFCLVICFFGLFAFPIAGTVLGGINVRYLAFSVLCFFTGLHLMGQSLYSYLPLWVDDPVRCMTLAESTSHMFGISFVIYTKVILKRPLHKLIGNCALAAYSVFVAALYVFHFTGLRDLYASVPLAQLFFTVCSIALAVCLFREIKENRDALTSIFTLLPLVVTVFYDSLNTYLHMTDFMTFEFGVAVSMLIQLVWLLMDLRRQYKETIRYQQIQRELYESRVAIMVSQIQPHFLYNSLTSIAMMCTIDPETAQEATITFADYLRGNMDSLKQKTPVPFSRELEHLNKYLYIEKLRFGDKLNIVYDIQTDSFVLPQLSIQPLVENAVKHGVGMKKKGGTVTIATREKSDCFEVIVSDDGVGFDTEQAKNDGRSHIGMENVRRRLKEMCGAEIIIKSVVGEGTVATVILPKEGQINENTVC